MAKNEKVTGFDLEVEDELQQDQIGKLWNKFGKYIVLFVICVILGTALSIFYANYQKKNRDLAAIHYQTLIDSLNADVDNSSENNEIANVEPIKNSGYELLYLLQKANIFVEKENFSEAINTYKLVIDTQHFEASYRNLAIIKASLILLQKSELQHAEYFDKQLMDLAQSNIYWAPFAKEIMGWKAINNGQADEAKNLFSEIVQNPYASSTMKDRIQKVLSIL